MSNKSKSNGGSKQASVSTSLYNNEQTTFTKQRQRSSSALPTFFRWFKKSNHRKSSSDKNNETYFSSASSAIETLNYDSYSSRDSLTPSSSPRLGHQQRYNNHINNFKNKNNINDHLSPSISCDSVISTSTTGFAFIRPNNYRPNGDAEEPKILIDNGPDTDSIQRRMKIYNTNCFPSSNENISNKRPEISLRRKYFLYGHSDTIRSNNIYQNHNSFAAGDRLELSGNYDNVNYLDYSLPNIGNNHQIDRNSNESNIQQIINRRRSQRQRRTVSDSSKDKKSGAYVHVKGKRKAPEPPTTNDSIYETPIRDNRQYRTLTPLSTLGRKKRKAPQPPIRFSPPTSSISSPPTSSLSSPSEELANSILSEGLLDDKDIKAIIDGANSNNLNQSNMSFSLTSNGNISESMSNPTSPIHKISSSINGNLSDPTSPASPISIRPWYKRSITTNRDSVIPFKREIVLRTMEKRKGKQKEQPILPDVSYSRSSTSSSIFDSGSKFGFFSKHKDNNASEDNRAKDNQKEKRKSGIGMPNISELDREAAEIISKEKAGLTPLSGTHDDKYYKPPEHLILQQQMFESNRIEKDAKDKERENLEEMEETAKSTKDLISKFESSSSSPKINLNTSFIGRTENFVDSKDIPNKKNEENIKLVKEIVKLSPTYTSNIKNDSKTIEDSSTKFDATENTSSISQAKSNETHEDLSTGLIKMTWSCPFCTLENPNWRIICEVCERLKPYEKNTNQLNVEKNSSPKFAKKLIQLTDKDVNKKSSSEVLSNSDWEKKTEKVKKYFQPRNNPTPPLTKSPSETSVSRKVINKSPSPSKLPICNSPKLSRTRYQQYDQQESKSTSSSNQFKLNNKIVEEKELNISSSDENKEPLLDKSAVTTTVTPVFYAITETANKNNIEMTKSKTEIDLEEIRNARLAKFSPNKTDKINESETEGTELAMSLKSLINSQISETEGESSTTPVENDNNLLINDSNLLEIEKQRLRDKIRAMNAKAMADNYPVNRNSLSIEQINIPADQPIPPQRSDKSRAKKISEITDSNYAIPSSAQTSKLGAIKKVFTKTSNSKNTKTILQKSQNNSIEDNFYAVDNNKPKKVSSSAQTAGMVKKQINSDSDAKIYVNLNKSNEDSDAIYENVPTYENQIFGQSKLLDDKCNEIKTEEYIKLSDIDKEEVKVISNQLKSAEGLNDFKATLKNSKNVKSISRTDTLVLNKIMKNLEVAIFNGKHEVAAKLAMDLAKMKVQLQVTKLKKTVEQKQNDEITERQNNNVDKTIIIDMFVEDRISQKGPIQITIQPLMTVKELKLKAFKDYHIPIDLQRWLINDQLLYDDNRTLLDCGVKDKSAGLYLYIIRPTATQQNQQNDINFKLPETSKAKPEEDDFSSDGGNSTDSHNGTIISIDDNIKGASALTVKSEPETQQNQNKQQKEITKTVENSTWQCSMCTLINTPLALACSACSRAKPLSFEEKSSISEELKKFLGGSSCINSNFNNNKNVCNSDNLLNIRPIEKRNDLNKKSPNRKSTDIYNIIEEIIKPPEQNIIIPSVMSPSVAVVANVMTTQSIKTTNVPIKNITPKRLAPNPNITKPNIVAEIKKIPPQQIGPGGNNNSINSGAVIKSTNNIIVSTSTTSSPSKYIANFSSPNITKSKYRGVDNFNPYRKDGTEPIPISKNPVLTKPQQQPSTKKDISLMLKTPYTISHYMEILKLDTTDVVRNSEPFDCPICLTKFQIGEGCVLRDCLHTFCRDCLASTIQYNEEAEIKCPYANPDYSCDSVLQEREIRSLVTLEIYEKHLAKSVRYAEHQIENAFHCKTPNCRGWCIYEDNVNQFKCPVCRITNCLTCRVIHDGLTCKQYQDRLNTDCDSNIDAKRTKEMLSEMVDKGEAMNCPTCQVIMMKKWGCDWLKCSMCKTEVCWVTRGPRWGAAGKGDTSGGCKCGVNGVKCHPKCNYCH